MEKLPRSGLVQPVIHMPFRPDNVILARFSSSFARASYQRSQDTMTETLYACRNTQSIIQTPQCSPTVL